MENQAQKPEGERKGGRRDDDEEEEEESKAKHNKFVERERNHKQEPFFSLNCIQTLFKFGLFYFSLYIS